MAPRTLVLHASDILARAYQSVTVDRRAADGRPTNALFGGVRTIRRALSFKDPDHAVAIVVATVPADWPADLRDQADAWREVLAAHGVPLVDAAAPEHAVADHVAAALQAGHDVVVVGSDKRLAQLVGDRVWWYEGHKDVRYTPDAIRKRFGVPPSAMADWLALVGLEGVLDGIPGIGQKGAVGLIEAHGSLRAALDDPDAVTGRAGNALRANLEQARQQLAAATLGRGEAPAVPLVEQRWRRPTARGLNRVYRDLELFSMLAAEAPAPAAAAPAWQVWDTPDAVEQRLASLGHEPVAIEAITEGPSPVRGVLVGLAVCWAEGQAAWLPLAGPRALDPALLASWAADRTRPKVGHDPKAAAVALAAHGIALRGIVFDTAIAAHLADPSAPASLGHLARVRLQRALPRADALLGTGASRSRWADLPMPQVAAYAAARADAARALWLDLAPGTDEVLLAEALDLSETLVGMETLGIACDRDDLAAAGADFATIEAELEAEIHRLAGRAFAIGSNKQLGEVLYEELGLKVLRRTKTGWSVATDVLERQVHDHPIVPHVIRWRQLRRLQDSWVAALSRAIGPDGRVHSTFHPARSFSGRLVNTEPDLGRVPGRTPELARIRHAFRAPEGRCLLSIDYDQLGLYVLAHLTRDPALVAPLQAGVDIHRATAAAVLDKPEDALTDDDRQLGKVINFATFAGQGASALALQLGRSPKEARRLIARFDQRYAGVRAFQDAQLAHAREHGWVATLGGRRWRIGDLGSLEPRDRAYAERLARRATHEGSVADVTRRGLLEADRALRSAGLATRPLLQVHDEVLFEVPHDELAAASELAADAMRGAFTLAVPLRVSIKSGPSWAELQG